MIPDYKIPNFQVYLGKKNSCEIRKLSKEDIDICVRIIGNRGFFIHSSLIAYLSNWQNL